MTTANTTKYVSVLDEEDEEEVAVDVLRYRNLSSIIDVLFYFRNLAHEEAAVAVELPPKSEEALMSPVVAAETFSVGAAVVDWTKSCVDAAEMSWTLLPSPEAAPTVARPAEL